MKKIFPRLICLMLIVLISGEVLAGRYYTLTDPETYEVRLVWELKNRGGGVARNIQIRLQLPNRENLPPYQKMLSYSLLPAGMKFKSIGEYTDIKIPALSGRSSLMIECKYWVTNYAIVYNLDAYAGGQYVTETQYLQPENGIESNSPVVVDLAKKITKGQAGNLDKAKSIYEFLNSHLEYQLFDEKSHSALKTLNRGYGSCNDYSFAFIALCRAIGIPARYVQGYRFDPAQITGQERELESKGHAWAEVQLPLIGWITVDPTYNYRVNGVKEVSYDFFGKIIPQDRHLFFGYTTGSSYDCIWEQELRKPAKVEVRSTGFIRKIR